MIVTVVSTVAILTVLVQDALSQDNYDRRVYGAMEGRGAGLSESPGYVPVGFPLANTRNGKYMNTVVVVKPQRPRPFYESRAHAVNGDTLHQWIDDDSRQAALALVEKEVNAPKGGVPECNLPVSVGIGTAEIPMVYFDPISYTCKYFVYSGKGGNGNRFENMPQCYTVCDLGMVAEGDDLKPALQGKKRIFVKEE